MATQLDDLSVAIGRLQEGQTQTHRRIDEIADNLERVVTNMHSLPPSPVCVEKHREIDKLKVSHAIIVARSSIIGGAIGATAAYLAKLLGFPPTH